MPTAAEDDAPSAVFDTSFWVHVYGLGLLSLVLRQFMLHYTTAVAAELPEAFASGREFWRLARDGEVRLAEPRLSRVERFGAGERATISVALEHREWVLLLDDRRAFEYAAGLGLRVLCTPLLIVALREDGELDLAAAGQLLDRLAAMGTMSPVLVELSRRLLK